MNKKAERIIENIFDVITNSIFYHKAKAQLQKDLMPHQISVEWKKGIITIQDRKAIRTLYTITIKEGK